MGALFPSSHGIKAEVNSAFRKVYSFALAFATDSNAHPCISSCQVDEVSLSSASHKFNNDLILFNLAIPCVVRGKDVCCLRRKSRLPFQELEEGACGVTDDDLTIIKSSKSSGIHVQVKEVVQHRSGRATEGRWKGLFACVIKVG